MAMKTLSEGTTAIFQVARSALDVAGVPIAGIIVATATTALSLSALFWVDSAGLDPLVSHSEFFAYSWIYGIRWGSGEQIFQPHSQLLFPVFALINCLLGLCNGTSRQILAGWSAASFYWPLFLMIASLIILYASLERGQGWATSAAFSSAVFLAAIPLFLDDCALFSTSYHSLAIPLALLGLFFWKQYLTDPARLLVFRYFTLLGVYTAACALGKPTFIAFVAPFFAMEALKALYDRSVRSVGNIAVAAGIAVLVYCAWIIAFYHQGVAGLSLHLSLSKLFMTSQYHWYDAAKGLSPLHWYFGYVIRVMGWLPTTLLFISLVLASLSDRPTIVLTGVATGFLAALSCLYFRS